jgi:hypothetical protein
MNTFYTGMYTKMYVKTICMYIYIEYTCLYKVCTWYTLVCTWFILVCSVSYYENAKPFPAQGNLHCKLACDPFMIGLDSAYVQESADWYINCLDAYILKYPFEYSKY